MRYGLRFLIVAWLAIGSAFAFSWNNAAVDSISVANLPYEARQTLTLIKTGGTLPYDRDGIVFGNYEKRLPQHQRRYYQEYTVKTPGQRGRGPRRIIAGAGGEFYYTEDHYRSFLRIRE